MMLQTDDDRLQVLRTNGLRELQISFNTIFAMHHEATACHMAEDIKQVLSIFDSLLQTARNRFSDPTSESQAPAMRKCFSIDYYHDSITTLWSFQSEVTSRRMRRAGRRRRTSFTGCCRCSARTSRTESATPPSVRLSPARS